MNDCEIVTSFYSAFQKGDAETMVSLYDDDIEFQDPAFGRLKGEQAKNMWRMLVERSKGQLQIEFSDIRQQGEKVLAHWEAHYLFSQTGRKVHNKIDAEFGFRNGKIIRHTDRFDFWKWSSMALGLPGSLLGWSPLVKNKVRKQCLYLLGNYRGES